MVSTGPTSRPQREPALRRCWPAPDGRPPAPGRDGPLAIAGTGMTDKREAPAADGAGHRYDLPRRGDARGGSPSGLRTRPKQFDTSCGPGTVGRLLGVGQLAQEDPRVAHLPL